MRKEYSNPLRAENHHLAVTSRFIHRISKWRLILSPGTFYPQPFLIYLVGHILYIYGLLWLGVILTIIWVLYPNQAPIFQLLASTRGEIILYSQISLSLKTHTNIIRIFDICKFIFILLSLVYKMILFLHFHKIRCKDK